MKIYTKAGDNGRSNTITRYSLPKNSPIFELLGALDELNSYLGVAKQKSFKGITDIIEEIQKDLIELSGEIAGGKKFADKKQIEKLEKSIDKIETAIPQFDGFIIPGKTELGALMDVCRTITRRAERAAVASQQKGGITKELLAYLNRLSDLLFVLARLCDLSEGKSSGSSSLSTGAMEGFCEKANVLCKNVREYAKRKGAKIVVAVCDAGGNAVCMQREDDAYIASIDIAVNKAFTSASLKMPTKELADLAKEGGSLYGIQNTNNGRIVIFGGGEPLIKNGVIVGAIGVSGSSAEDDTAFAEYGKTLFEKEM